ncbi:Hypp654 [Branchiostoma lanceolatum]|uniref:Hypp654 protein n=1 Tax=Branchiostoma lanceolatum TaxID=7740 RepID=A0A8J9VB42_BRALA|nr:Hypp654 [Branchiostoma lanceolatum]
MNTEPDVQRSGADSTTDPRVQRRYSPDVPRRSDASSINDGSPSGSSRSVSAPASELSSTSADQWESIGPASIPSSESGDSSFNMASLGHERNIPHDTPGANDRQTSPVTCAPTTCLSTATHEDEEHNKQFHIEQQTFLEETKGGCKEDNGEDSTKTRRVQAALNTISLVTCTQDNIVPAATVAERASTTIQKSVDGMKKAIQTCTALEAYAMSIVQEAMSSAANHRKESKAVNARNLGRDGIISEMEEAESRPNKDAEKVIDDNFCDMSAFIDDHGNRDDATMTGVSVRRDSSSRDVSDSQLLPHGNSADAHASLSPRDHRPPSSTHTDRISPGPQLSPRDHRPPSSTNTDRISPGPQLSPWDHRPPSSTNTDRISPGPQLSPRDHRPPSSTNTDRISPGPQLSPRDHRPPPSTNTDRISLGPKLSPRDHRPSSFTNTDRISPGPVLLSITQPRERVTEDNYFSPPADTTTSPHEAVCSLHSDVSGRTGTEHLLSSTSRGDDVALSPPSRVLDDVQIDSSDRRRLENSADIDDKENELLVQSGTASENNSKASSTKAAQSDAHPETISAANERDRIRRLRVAVETLVEEFRLEQELEALLKGNQPGTFAEFATDEEDIEMIRDAQSDLMEMLPQGAEESRAFRDEVRSILASVKKKRRGGHIEGNNEKKTSHCSKSTPWSYVIKNSSSSVNSHVITGPSEESVPHEKYFEKDKDLPDSLVINPPALEDTPVAVRCDSFMETIPLITEDVSCQDDDVVVTTGTPEQLVTTADHDSGRTGGKTEEANVGYGAVPVERDQESTRPQTTDMVDGNNAVPVECDQKSTRPQTTDMVDGNNAVPVECDQESTRPQTTDMVDGNNAVPVECDQESTRPQTTDMVDGNNAVPVECDQESARPQTTDMVDGNNAVPVECDQESTRPQTTDMVDGNNAVPVECDQESTRPQTTDMVDGNNAVPVECDQESTRPQPTDMVDGNNAVPVECDQESTRPQPTDMVDGNNAVPVECDQESTRPQTTDMVDGNNAVPVECDQESARPQTTDMVDGNNAVPVECDQESARPQTTDMVDGNNAVPVECDQESTRPQTTDMVEGNNAVPVECDLESTRPQTTDMVDGNNAVPVECDQESTRPQTTDMVDGNNAVPVECDQESTRPQTTDMVDGNNAVPVECDQESTRPQTTDMVDGNNAVPVECDLESTRPQPTDMVDGNNAVPVECDQESTRPQTTDMVDGNNAVPVECDQESTRPQTTDMVDGNDTVPVECDQESTRPQTTDMVDGNNAVPVECDQESTRPQTTDMLDEGIESDSSEGDSPKPVTASRSHRQLELIQAESSASSEGKMMMRSRHSSDSPEAHRRSPLAMEDGDPFREEDMGEGCGTLGQTDTDVALVPTADSLPLLLDTDKLHRDLPQLSDEQISPNTIIKSMSDLQEHRFMAVHDYRRSYMDREPILYRGDIVKACKTPNVPYYSLTSVDVLTLVPESYLRPLDSGDAEGARV